MSDFDVLAIPDELNDIHRWGYAKLVKTPRGDLSKIPCTEFGIQIDHGRFIDKLTSLHRLDELKPPAHETKGEFVAYAYGISLGDAESRRLYDNGETGLLVLDYDHVCNEFGQFHDSAIAQVIENFKRVGYVERSASGTGYHVVCWKPKDFDKLKPPQKDDGKDRAIKLKITGKGNNVIYSPFGKGCDNQNILEMFYDNRFIVITGKNEGQCSIVPADNITLLDVVKSALKPLKGKFTDTDAADETPQENGVDNVGDVDDVAADPETPTPTSKAAPKRINKCAHKSGTVTHDPDRIQVNMCQVIKGMCEMDKDALYNDETPIPAGADASEKAMSVCNYIVNKSGDRVNADELNWLFTHSPFYKANYSRGKAHVWNDSKASKTYENALNQKHENGGKRAAGRPSTASQVSGLPYENFSTQKGLCQYIKEHLTDLVMYDEQAKQWYIKDKDGYCYTQSQDNGYSYVKDSIFDEIDKIEDPYLHDKASRFCTMANIRASIDLSKSDLSGIPSDIAYVFDGGKTLLITQDDDGHFSIDTRDTPKGLKTVFRIHGDYWEGEVSECPQDFQNWINGYGAPQFVECLLRAMSRSLTCHPDKLCFQFTSDDGNTGKSTFDDCIAGAWGRGCYTCIIAKELLTTNQAGRRTALLQAIQKPWVVVREAEGKLSEGTYQDVVDTSETFSGDYCGKDRVEVQRRGQVFIETNGLIRANNTSAYANRTYPIEFTRVFPMDDRIQAKIKSTIWRKYARGITIRALKKYVAEFNAGKGIADQIAALCPILSSQRIVLSQKQDFKQQVIMEVAKLGTNNDIVKWSEVWDRVYDTFRGSRYEIEEWGMTKKDPINPESPPSTVVRDFNKTLKRMGFIPYRGNKNVWEVKKIVIKIE